MSTLNGQTYSALLNTELQTSVKCTKRTCQAVSNAFKCCFLTWNFNCSGTSRIIHL